MVEDVELRSLLDDPNYGDGGSSGYEQLCDVLDRAFRERWRG